MNRVLEYGGSFWQRVLNLLAMKQLSQSDLSRMTGLSTGSISSSIRRGTIPVSSNAVRIAQALDTTVEYLVTGIDKSAFGEFADEPELKLAFQTIKKGKYNSMIAQALPFLNLEQQQTILAVIKSMGVPVQNESE